MDVQGRTQFRLQFSLNARTGADYLSFYSGNAALANRPVIVVEWEARSG